AGRSGSAACHLRELFPRPVRVATDDAQACLGLGSLALGRNLVSLAQPRSHTGRVLTLGRLAWRGLPRFGYNDLFFRDFPMKTAFLDFEQPIAELEAKSEEL